MPSLERAAGWLNLGVITAAIVVFLVRNIGNDAIWDAESDGVIRSLGYPSGYEMKGLGDVLEGTKQTNDAGGFDVLLHWWMQAFGTGIVALRWLPFLFFVVYLLALLVVGRRLRLPWWAASAVVGVMLVENITPYYALEIRPYAPMLAASVAMLALAGWLASQPGPWRALGFVSATVLLLSHHYSSIGLGFAAATVLVIAAWQYSARMRVWLLLPAAFALLWLPATYLALRGLAFGAGDSRVWYLDNAMLRFADAQQWWHILSWNFLTPTGLPRTVFLIIVPVLWILARRGRGSGPGSFVVAAWAYVLAATLAEMAMSIAGFLPWYLGTRWAISDVGLIAISLAGITTIVLPWVRRRPVWLLGAVILLGVLAAFAGAVRMATYDRGGPVGYLKTIGQEMVAGGPGSLTVDPWIYYDLRYLIEWSGDYNDLRPGWDENRATVLFSQDYIEAPQIREFLESDRTRLLIRNPDPLEGIALPPNVEVISTEDSRGPRLLVKR